MQQYLAHPVLGPKLREAKVALDRITYGLDAQGILQLPHVDLPMTPHGVGFALTRGGPSFAVICVAAGRPESMAVGLGLARGIDLDRLRLLDWVNEQTRFGLAYAPYLCKNANTWDIVIRRHTNVTIMAENPSYCAMSIFDGFDELEYLRARLGQSVVHDASPYSLTPTDATALMVETISW